MDQYNVENDSDHWEADCLESELGSPPVSPLGIVTDGVASSHPDNNLHEKKFHFLFQTCLPDPLRNGTILFHLLGKLMLDTEGLKCRHFLKERKFAVKIILIKI